MRKIYFALLWLLVLLSGGCAINEVMIGGSVLALIMIVAGLGLIIYIMGLPLEIKND